jgi:hypothetical protein
MLTVCAWCQKINFDLERLAWRAGLLHIPVSHGICQEHLNIVLEEQRAYAELVRSRKLCA